MICLGFDTLYLKNMFRQTVFKWSNSGMCISQSSNSFPNTDQPIGGRFAGAGVAPGEGREEKSAGAAEAGAEEGGEGACSQTTTEGETSQERGRPICCLQSSVHSQDQQLWYGASV